MQHPETSRSFAPAPERELDSTGQHSKRRAVVGPPMERLATGMRFGPLGRYELLSRVGRGGNSIVHAVYDHLLERRLAGKFLVRGGAAVAKAESRALARLNHSNIVTLHDLGSLHGTPYLLLELLEGVTLADLIAHEPRLDSLSALRVTRAVAAALEHAHSRGVFHFDVKPSNVHIGCGGRVKLMDFGVGSRLFSHLQVSEDVDDDVVGTPCYMAPEQWNGGTLDARTDVWGVGMLLYESLTGMLPDRAQHLGYTLARRSPRAGGSSYLRLSARLGLPSTVDEVLERSLTADPAARFVCVSELLASLKLAERAMLEVPILQVSPREPAPVR